MSGRICVLGIAMSLLPLTVSAQDATRYRCVNGDAVRRVEVAYLTASAAVPCEVRYFKDTEAPGQAEVPWRADNEVGFCEQRAEELVGRLRGFGWNCVAAAAPVADDTDALSAGGEAAP